MDITFNHADTGIRPILLSEIFEEVEAQKLCADDSWCMQEKKDGVRMLLRHQCEKVEGIARRGTLMEISACIGVSGDISRCDYIIDGELVNDIYYAFDILELRWEDVKSLHYSERLDILRDLCVHFGSYIRFLDTHYTTESKRDALHFYKQRKCEGVVFRKLDAPYISGRSKNAIKYKF